MATTEELKELARKRAIEVTKQKAATLSENAVKASPSGMDAASKAKADAIAKAKEGLKGGALQGTSIEEEPGFFNQAYHRIGRFLTDTVGALPQEGDYDPKMEAFQRGTTDPISVMLRTGIGTLGILDTVQNRDERTGDITPLNTAANSALDVVTIGGANKIRGGIDYLGDYVHENAGYQNGMDPNAYLSKEWQEAISKGERKTYAEYVDERALEQEEIRAANPGTAIGADILTSMFTGSAIAKAGFGVLNKFPTAARAIGRNWYGRILFGSGLGAGEVMAYRLNKDGDLEQATQDASLAMLGGMALGTAFESAKGMWNIARNTKPKDVIQEAVGGEILRMINIERQTQGLPPAKVSDIAAEVAKMGPDATLMDLFPDLRQFAEHVLRNEDEVMAGTGLRAIIATRADMLEDLLAPDGTLKTIFGAKAVRGETQFFDDVKARQKVISPRYERIKKDYASVRFDAKKIKDDLLQVFGGAKERLSTGQLELIDFIDDQLKTYLEAGTKKVKTATGKGTVKPKGVTLENMLDLRAVLGKQTGTKGAAVTSKGGRVSLDNLDYKDLSTVSSYISDLMHLKVPKLEPLDKVYGNIGATRSAYKAGLEAFTKTMKDSFDVGKFLTSTNKSAAEKRAFIEGAKYRIFKTLNKAKSADDIEKVLVENRDLFGRMEALFGKQGLQAMIDDVMPNVRKLKTAEVLGAAKAKRVGDSQSRFTPVGEAIDIATAIGGIPGIVSKAGAFGALRRLVGQAIDPAELAQKRQMFGDVLSQAGDQTTETFKMLEQLQTRSIRPSDMGAIKRSTSAVEGVDRYLNMDASSDEELPE